MNKPTANAKTALAITARITLEGLEKTKADLRKIRELLWGVEQSVDNLWDWLQDVERAFRTQKTMTEKGQGRSQCT